MKKYIYLTIGIIFVVLFGYLTILQSQYNALEKDYYTTKSNEKAYLLENENSKENIRALTLTIEELELAKDSVLKDLNTVRKNLKIKDDKIKSLQNIKTEIVKTDTLILRDTIFQKETFKLDTLLGDKWASLNLYLQYPSTIGYKMNYNSDLDVVVYNERETVDPPKKCWLLRIFQKKRDVTRVEVKDNNPYSNIKDQTFVIIE